MKITIHQPSPARESSEFTLYHLLLSALAHLKRAVTTPITRQQPWRSAGNLAALAACFWFSIQAGAANTYVVTSATDAGVNTLRNIVQQANVDPPGDIITFAPNLNLIVINSGEIAIQNDLTISGPGATNLTIIGESPHDRVFEIEKNNNLGVTVTISGLRFTGGYYGVDGNPPSTQQNPNGQNGWPAQGGMIYNDRGCVLTLSNCIMDQCYAIGGNGANGFGGVLAPPGTGGFGAAGIGGAISTVGKLYVYECTFLGNLAAGGNGGAGTNASSSFNGSKGGDAADAYGGAIYVEYHGDSPAITAANCTFFNNLARGGVGGRGGDGLLAAHGGDGGKGGNANGGALYHADLNCQLGDCGNMTHCTVSQNYLQPGFGGAGGIGNINGTPGANGAGSGGGLCLRPQFFEVGNTIVAGDGCLGAAACTAPDVQGAVASQGFNLIGADDCNNCSGWTVVAPGLDQRGTVAIPLDPRLGLLQNNGGQTPTMAPLAGSPAIDFGGPTSYSTDQAGQIRPVIVAGIQNGGDGSDIGAYELQCSLDVPTLSAARSGNGVILSWPWPSTCFVLQQSSDLKNWVDSTYAINVVGNQNQVVINPAPGNLFFRLKK
jgi:hypothetical protein